MVARDGNDRSAELREATVAAGGVLAVLLVNDVVAAVLSMISSATVGGQGTTYFGAIIGGSWIESLSTSVPFAVGALIGFHLLIPTGAVPSLSRVIRRSVLVAAVGGGAVLVVGVAMSLTSPLGGYDFAYVAGAGLGAGIASAVFGAVQTAALALVTATPLVVLAGLLLWLWRRRADRPSGVDGMPGLG